LVVSVDELPSVTFHGLRHSHTTYLAECEFPVVVAMERLGHKNAKTTMEIYSHVTASMQDAVAKRQDADYRKLAR
jgi:integrase